MVQLVRTDRLGIKMANVTSNFRLSGTQPIHNNQWREIMPTTEQDKIVIADVVDAFSLAIIEVCQTMEHQRSMPLTPHVFASEFKLRAQNLPNDSNGTVKRKILTNIANGLMGEEITPFRVP